MSKQMDVLARSDLFDAATRLEEQADVIDRMRSEMVNPDDLSQQLLKLVAGMNQANATQVRPEPSRLEIAAMIFANDNSHGGVNSALRWADELIAAAKEAK